MHLVDDYLVFSENADAQVLVWDVDDDTRKMLQVMLTFHSEQIALTPDLIFAAELAFTNAEFYEYDLLDVLLKDLEESRPDLDDPLKSWKPSIPAGAKRPLLAYLGEMADRLSEHVPHVTIYFRYESIENPRAFGRWLYNLIRLGVPKNVQIAVFDDKKHRIRKALEDFPRGLVMVRSPSVDMNKTMEETFTESQDEQPEGPEKDYQEEIVFAVTALRRQDFDTAFKRAEKAFLIAQEKGWSAMQITALLVYGNAVLGKNELSTAVRCARQAISIREMADESEDQTMLEGLNSQARFLEANVQALRKDWAKAADAYERAAESSAKLGNAFLEFEARRMAAQCYLKNREPEKCFSIGFNALSIAQEFPDDLKKSGTLPHLVKDLVKSEYALKDGHKQLHQRMTEIIGENWRSEMTAI